MFGILIIGLAAAGCGKLVALLLGIIIIALLSLGMSLNKNFVPTPQDEDLRLEASVTKTANFAGTTKDLGAGFSPGGVGMAMGAVVNATAGDRADSNETYTFTLKESDDDSTYTACGPAVTIDVATTVFTVGAICVPGFVSKRYVKLDLVVAGTTPSITYEAWLNPNMR